MLSKEKVYENGTEVFIFKYVLGRKKQDTKNYIMGTIVSSEESKDVSLCKGPEYVINYLVLGEDQKLYYGNMGKHVLGDYFFMTRELYNSHIEEIILENEKEKQIIDLDTEKWKKIKEAINSNKDNEPKKLIKQ